MVEFSNIKEFQISQPFPNNWCPLSRQNYQVEFVLYFIFFFAQNIHLWNYIFLLKIKLFCKTIFCKKLYFESCWKISIFIVFSKKGKSEKADTEPFFLSLSNLSFQRSLFLTCAVHIPSPQKLLSSNWSILFDGNIISLCGFLMTITRKGRLI